MIREAKRIGLDGMCITDHDSFWDPDRTQELSRLHDLLVLPGCEVTTNEGHLLVYGLSEYVFGMHRASLVKELEAKGIGRPSTYAQIISTLQDREYVEKVDKLLKNKEAEVMAI